MPDGYQSPIYGKCPVKLANGQSDICGGYLLIPLGEGDTYFHPYNGAAPVKVEPGTSNRPFWPFMPG